MKRDTLIILALAALTFAAFCELGRCDFINFDDPGYITFNPHVTSGLSAGNFAWAWTTFYVGNYIPLTWLSLMLDATLFGAGPQGFHWVNLGFHVTNAILVFLFFRQATGAVWRSALVAAIFAVHPLRVESVAWVVERKDVLSGFFGLLTLLAYLRFARTLKLRWYAAVVLLFAMCLLAKQTLSTLPFLLLILDYWPLRRWVPFDKPVAGAIADVVPPRRSLPHLIAEKLPLLAMVAAILVVTAKAQATVHTILALTKYPLSLRLANVPVSYVRYLRKMGWFGDLAVFYPLREWLPVQVIGASLLLAAITALAVWKSRKWPWLIVGWLWFLGVLVPMIGVVQFASQSMADRFTYISAIGISVAVIWSIPARVSGRSPVLAVAGAITVVGLLIVFTVAQVRYWRNSIALFRHDIAVAGRYPITEFNLGSALGSRSTLKGLKPEYRKELLSEGLSHVMWAAKMDPSSSKSQCTLAWLLNLDHQTDMALSYARRAIAMEPDNAYYHFMLGWVLIDASRYREAEEACRKAIQLDPNLAEGHYRLGIALREMGNVHEAAEQFRLVLSIKPDLAAAREDLQKLQTAEIKVGHN